MGFRDQVNAWLSTITRAVGIAAVIYEMIGDHFNHPEALVLFGIMAGVPDILGAMGITITKKRRDD